MDSQKPRRWKRVGGNGPRPCRRGERRIRRTEGLAGGVRPERKVGLSGLLSREEQRRGLGGQEREMNLG